MSAGATAVPRPVASADVAYAPAAAPSCRNGSGRVAASAERGAGAPLRSAAGKDTQPRQLLTFLAAGYEYAVSILHVREIAEHRPLTPVPGTPSWIRGVMNLRGTVVPVVDLAAKLGLSPASISRRTCLLIVDVTVNSEPMVLAIMVDGVSRVVDLAPDDLQDVPSFGPCVDTTFLRGMMRLENRLVLLLDIDRIVESGDVLATAAALSAIESRQGEARP